MLSTDTHKGLRNPGDANGGDAGNGGAATTPGADANNPTATGAGQPTDVKTFTQEQLNQIVSRERNETRSKATSDFIAELGYKDPDELKTAVTNWKAQQSQQMTELEKAQAELSALKDADLKAKSTQEALDSANAALAANVKAQLAALKVPGHVSKLIEAMSPLDALNYLTENAEALKPVTTPDIDANKNGGSKKRQVDEARLRSNYNI